MKYLKHHLSYLKHINKTLNYKRKRFLLYNLKPSFGETCIFLNDNEIYIVNKSKRIILKNNFRLRITIQINFTYKEI